MSSSRPSGLLELHRHRGRGALLREVRDIIALPEPVIRNLRITLSYHDLTVAMTELLGQENISWVGFATWASRTAGGFIRNDYMPNIVQAYMDKLSFFHRGVHLAHNMLTGVRRGSAAAPPRSLLEATVERVSDVITDNISGGNVSVYADVAPVFAGLIELARGPETLDEPALEAFLAELRPGPVERDGQDLLVTAFRSYYKAMIEPDRKKRAEHILFANNLVGFHEQNRLQKHIFRSLNAPVADLIADVAQDRFRQLTHERLHDSVDGMVERMMRPFYRWLQKEWATVATRWLMRMELPEMTLSLGEDLPARCEHYMFPRDLMVIKNSELGSLLERVDYTPDTVEGSAANDWGSIDDRMNFIVDFFRTRQQDPTLFEAPFTEAQIRLIRSNSVPSGL